MCEVLEVHPDAMADDGEWWCEAMVDFLGVLADCPFPAIGRYQGTCPCGHVRVKRLCETHAEIVELAACRACLEAQESAHDCPVTVVRLEDRL